MNEDKVVPGGGFMTHPHREMEIISYVVSGELQHKDSMGNGSIIGAGEFQLISAGTGITHSEFNPSDEKDVHFYQIWIAPKEKGVSPHYHQKSLSNSSSGKPLQLVASPGGQNKSLPLNQDVNLYFGKLKKGEELNLQLPPERYGWVQMIEGETILNEVHLSSGDGASFYGREELSLLSKSDCILLFFDLS